MCKIPSAASYPFLHNSSLVNDCSQCELSAWLSGIKEDRNCCLICGNCWQSGRTTTTITATTEIRQKEKVKEMNGLKYVPYSVQLFCISACLLSLEFFPANRSPAKTENTLKNQPPPTQKRLGPAF